MTNDIDTMYGMLTENRMELMYLPSGCIAWLWSDDRPEEQVNAACELAMILKKSGLEATEAALLRSDHNVLMIQASNGIIINVYPSGGYGIDGDPYDESSLIALLQGTPEFGIGTSSKDVITGDMMSADELMAIDDPVTVEPVLDTDDDHILPNDIEIEVIPNDHF